MIELILFFLPVNLLFLSGADAVVRSPHGSHDVPTQLDYWAERSPAEVCQVDLAKLAEKWKVERVLNILRQGGDLLLEVIYSLRYDLLVDVGDS